MAEMLYIPYPAEVRSDTTGMEDWPHIQVF